MQQQTININLIKPNEGQIEGLPSNPRFIRDDSYKSLVKSLREDPDMLELRELIVIPVNGEYVTIGGNMRLRAGMELQFQEMPCKVLPEDTTVDKLKRIAIKDNGSWGSHDWDALANEWGDLPLAEWGIQLPDDWGSPVTELEPGEEGEVDLDPPKEPITVLGDLYELNGHRLHCADSTDSDAVAKLMDGKKADMVFTDPPYGIAVVKNNMVGADFGVAKKGKYEPVANDETKDVAKEFYDTCIALGFEKFIIWGGNYFVDFLPFSDGWLIWDKRVDTGIKNTFADGEMAWCSFHTPVRIYKQLWNGMIREGEHEKRVHPTQKPIRILTEIIQDHVKGDLVYDGFLGSGSTLIACETIGRGCYGVELSPAYCDVIIYRYTAFMLKNDRNFTIKRNGKDVTEEWKALVDK